MLTRKFYLGFFIFPFMVGCSNPDSDPQLRDPIYQDLQSESSKTQKDIDTKKKDLENHQKSFTELHDNDFQKIQERSDIFKTQNEITKLEQKLRFYKASAESREIYARKEYLEAYKNGKDKDWPSPETKILYHEQKRAEAAPTRWSRGMASEKPVAKPGETKKPAAH
jgi:hypothetical protein